MIPNGSRVTVTRTTPRHAIGVLVAQDEERGLVATPKRCHVCGEGPCRTIPLYTEDVARFKRVHPVPGIPSRWQYRARPLAEISQVDEH